MSSVQSIILDQYQKTIKESQWDTVYGSVHPYSATNKCVWYSSNHPDIVYVDSETGCIHGIKPGYAVITVYSDENPNIKSYCEVTVENAIHVTSVSLNKSEITLSVGDYYTELCAKVLPTNATNKNVRFISSNSNVARVYSDGGIKALSPGKIEIEAISYDGNLSDKCTVNVGCSHIINGKKVMVFDNDDTLLDESNNGSTTELIVYANDMLIPSAREECNGEITVCMGEIVEALCTDYFLNPTFTEWSISTSHKDLKIYREKVYKTKDLGICPFDGIRDRISLEEFVNDMGYNSKYSCVTYSNGTKIVIIQGHDWYSAAPVSSFAADTLLSLELGFIPYIGDAIDLIDGVIGKDIITGETLSTFDRLLCIGCTFIPAISGSSVRVGKKGFTTVDNLVKHIDDLPEAKKILLHTDIWNILKPITRGICIETEFAHTVYKSSSGWYHLGKEMNGFFPVIDFIKVAEKSSDTIAISMKTLDPRLYKLSNNNYNYTKIKSVINTYANKLKTTPMFIDSTNISKRQLDLVIPKGYKSVIDKISKELETSGITFNIIEL